MVGNGEERKFSEKYWTVKNVGKLWKNEKSVPCLGKKDTTSCFTFRSPDGSHSPPNFIPLYAGDVVTIFSNFGEGGYFLSPFIKSMSRAENKLEKGKGISVGWHIRENDISEVNRELCQWKLVRPSLFPPTSTHTPCRLLSKSSSLQDTISGGKQSRKKMIEMVRGIFSSDDNTISKMQGEEEEDEEFESEEEEIPSPRTRRKKKRKKWREWRKRRGWSVEGGSFSTICMDSMNEGKDFEGRDEENDFPPPPSPPSFISNPSSYSFEEKGYYKDF